MRYLITIILCTSCLLGWAQSQDTLFFKPGSSEIDASFFENYTNKWKVTFITKEGKEIPNRIWTDFGQRIELNGKTYLHRVQDLYSPDYKLQDTWINMVELPSLKPWYFSTINPNGGFSYYNFYDDKLIIRSNLNKEAKTNTDTLSLDNAIFDWNLYGMLLTGLDFNEGTIYSMPFYNPVLKQVSDLVVNVVGEETVTDLNNKSYNTWKLMTNQNLTFWITKNAPYVIKLELIMPERGKLVWDIY